MWDGITYVDPTHRPVIHEGVAASNVIVTNAGPSSVELLVWEYAASDKPPKFKMLMPPGNTRSTSGEMIAVGIHSEDAPYSDTRAQFAAVAWRIVS